MDELEMFDKIKIGLASDEQIREWSKGEVKKPGVYEVSSDSIIQDVIDLSGGLTKNANTRFISLSKILEDENTIVIYSNKEISDAKRDNKLEVTAIPENPNAVVTITGNDNLSIGKNEITITVVAEDGNKSIYTIYITKKSNICPIKSIKILNYNLDFNCDKYDYELKINKEDSLNIEIIPNDKKTKVNIYNNDNLKNGDIITIKLKIDNADYEYHIKIIKINLENVNIINNKQFIFLIIVISLMSIKKIDINIECRN